MRYGKQIVAIIVIITMLCSICGAVDVKAGSDNSAQMRVKKGDIITFGLYEQDNNMNNGKEPIEWIVLKVNSDKALLLCKYGLEAMPYNDENDLKDRFSGEYGQVNWSEVKVTWEDSTIRKWLNEDFYSSAFDENQKRKIVETLNENPDNPLCGTKGGNATLDKVFLLSLNDLTDTEYGFNSDSKVKDVARRCAATKYADKHGVYTYENLVDDEDGDWENYATDDGKPTCEWWLRTPGAFDNTIDHPDGYDGRSNMAVTVSYYGHIYRYGNYVVNTQKAVRPAIWLNLGTNNSSENNTEPSNTNVTIITATGLKGDVNGDSAINAKDVTQLRRYLAGGWNVEIDKNNSDVNNDNEVNAKDVTMLRRYLAGGWGVELSNDGENNAEQTPEPSGTPTETQPSPTPSNLINPAEEYDAVEYNGHYYKIVMKDDISWTDAKQECADMGGHLVTITSQEEQNYIDSLNKDWIGGYRDSADNWKWVTGEKWDYTNWAEGEPNNSSNVVSNESCIAIWPEEWNDLADTNTYEQSGYICEWDGKITTPTQENVINPAEEYGAVEYNGHYYKIVIKDDISWTDAKQECADMGGHLVTITSQEEQDYIDLDRRLQGFSRQLEMGNW